MVLVNFIHSGEVIKVNCSYKEYKDKFINKYSLEEWNKGKEEDFWICCLDSMELMELDSIGV